MSETEFSTIGRGGYELPQPANLPGYPQVYQAAGQATTAAQEAAKTAGQASPVRDAASSQKSDQKPDQKSDVSLEFKIDPENKNVTVLILNKSSRKVIRTIPPEELSKLHEGDLVELFG